MQDKIGISEETVTKDDMELLFDLIVQTMDQMDTKRLVIDPLNPLLNLLERTEMKFFMRGLRGEVLDRGMLAMLSYDTVSPSAMWGQKVLEQDMLDVLLCFSRVHDRQASMNCMTIERWRASPHSSACYVIEIAPEGVVLVPRLGSGGVV
jgi:KaiC/GvpD/RAD55 family RecA-like ATPase